MLRTLVLALVFAVAPSVAAAFTLAPGFHYSSSETQINVFDASGIPGTALPYTSGETRGIAAAPNGYLYVVVSAPTTDRVQTRVDVLDADGQRVGYFGASGPIRGNIGLGKIAFDATGSRFYVGTGDGVYAFTHMTRGGQRITTSPALDVDVLPSGELLVGGGTQLSLHLANGALISSFSAIDDPDGLAGVTAPRLVDVQGVAYSERFDVTYVTMLGYTNFSFRLLAFAGTSNRLIGATTFWYGSDIHVDASGDLLVGSRTQAPAWFGPDLQWLGSLGGPNARFVTGFPAKASDDNGE